jgi:DNA polymerase-4
LILIKADFDKYFDYTKRFYALIRFFSPEVNLFSLDEAFLDVTHCLKPYGSVKKLAVKIQAKIFSEMGEWVTVSIGIAKNRMLAKLAGEFAAKGGFFAIDEDNLDLVLGLSKITDICGIGKSLSKKLESFGISNPLQIRSLDLGFLKKWFGPFWGPELMRIAWGENSHGLTLLDKNQHMQGVGRTITGYRLCDSEVVIRRTIKNLIEEIATKLRSMNLAGRHLSIFLEGENGFWYRHKTVKHYIRHSEEIFDVLYNSLYKTWKRDFSVIRFGVRIDQLRQLNQLTACWLPQWRKREALWHAADRLNQKYGLFTVRSGTLVNFSLIRPEVTGYLGDKLYHFGNNL